MSNPIKDLGPCEVFFNSIPLGDTEGGVMFRWQEDSKPVNTDLAGVTDVDGIKVGSSICEVEVPLTRTSLGSLSTIIGGSSYTGSKLRVRGQVGVSMLDNAKVLELKPKIDNAVSTTHSLKLMLAYPRANPEIAFSKDNQRIYKVTFKGFPDSNGICWELK